MKKSSDRHDGRYPLPCFPPGRLPALLLLEEPKEGLRSRQRELLLSDRAAQRPQQVRRVPLQAGKALCAGSLLQGPDTDPISSDENDWMSEREQLEEYFSQSLEVDLLLRLCPDDEDGKNLLFVLVDFCIFSGHSKASSCSFIILHGEAFCLLSTFYGPVQFCFFSVYSRGSISVSSMVSGFLLQV